LTGHAGQAVAEAAHLDITSTILPQPFAPADRRAAHGGLKPYV
jgi:hypothetical protein